MTQLDAISILLENNSEEKVLDYIAKKIRFNENYFKKFTKDQLLFDFVTS